MDQVFTENAVKQLIVDGTGHITGRLAAVVAKLLLNSQFVVVVNCSEIVKTGDLKRNLAKWGLWKKKTCNANPRHGPKHHRAPKAMFFRTVRGMVPRKKWRGLAALRRLKVYDGVPPQYFYSKKLCAPIAMADLKLKEETRRTKLGDLAEAVGWTKYDLIKKFEQRRKENEKKLIDHHKKVDEVKEKAITDLASSNQEYQKICKEIESLELSLM